MLTRITTMLEHIPFFLQPGTKVLNRGSIEFENESRIIASATGANSIRGLSINLLYLDEFAFVENAEQFYTATYPVVTSGGQSKVIITSTANGIGNMYHKLYEGAVQEQNEYKHFKVHWRDVPGRDDAWKKMTIANTSELQFEQEFGNSFLGTGNTLINANTLLGLQAGDPIWFKQNTYLYEEPKEGEIYIVNTEKDTLKHLEVEVAKTAQEQSTGLMFRRTMKENRGMIFVYFTERPRYFYMKNTFIPLDLIYVNGENKIVEFNENATPLSEETLPNNIPSQFVLEVNGGKVSEWGLQLNDSLIMHLEE